MSTWDIIITAYNNATELPRALSALQKQHVPTDVQVRLLLADDGSTDRTAAVVQEWREKLQFPLQFITGPHGGAATARNRALDQVTADLILFLQADMLLSPEALTHHQRFHNAHPEAEAAALGWVLWDPRLEPTPLMEWMVHGGPQNDYDQLLGVPQADARRYFYGAQLSLKRQFVGQARFSLDFQEYGWEDIEFGHRLHQQGLRLYCLPQAVGWHHHYYTGPMISRRQRAVGRGSIIYQKHHTDPTLLPPATAERWIKYHIARLCGIGMLLQAWLKYGGQYWATPRLFALATAYSFWAGVFSAQSRKK